METAETPRRRTIGEAAREAEALATYMRGAPGAAQVMVAGSFRRGRETVGDLDLVVGAAAGPPVIEYFIRFPAMAEMPAAGATRATIVLRTGLQVDLRVVKPESFGAALLYFTGSKAHGVALRAEARGRGMKLNEYGLYRGKRRLAGETEAGIYEALGLDYVPPELREARGEIEAARAHALPRLVGRRNIKGDMHLHHDGEPIAQMIEAAQKQGLSYLTLVSRLDRLGKASLRVRRTEADRAAPPPMRLFHAIEVDIAADGALAASERALKDADFVMAAVNADFDLPRARQTDRLLAAIANPHVAILAHPTCRLLNRRDPLDADWPRVLRAAAEAGVALELTGDPERLDLTDLHCRMARDAGALVALSSDARAQDELDQIHFALTQARRGWLEPRHVLNTVPADKMLARLRTSVRGRSRR
jgi:DNA polymerase (family 10)